MIVYMNLSMICKYMENDLYSISSKKKKENPIFSCEEEIKRHIICYETNNIVIIKAKTTNQTVYNIVPSFTVLLSIPGLDL
jgi:hypothetical protein